MHTYRYLAVLAAVIASMMVVGKSEATESLRTELSAISQSISKLLEGRGESSIAIGQFTGPPNFPTSAGPGIVKILADEFTQRGITVKKRAQTALKGEYLLSEMDLGSNKFLAVRIAGSLVDQFGNVITEFNFEGQTEGVAQPSATISHGVFDSRISDEKTFLHLTGIPADLPANYPREDRDFQLREYILEPPSWIEDRTRVSTAKESPYSVEIVVDGLARVVSLDEDLPFVEINRGETYEVRINNASPYDAAVTLTIDGLNSFEFSDMRRNDGRPLYSYCIVPRNSQYAIRGWHRDNERVDSFLVTEFAQGRAAKVFQNALQNDARFGTITASFAAAWPVGTPPPRDEQGTRRGLPSNATGKGQIQEARMKEVRRHVGVVRSSVSIRYSR